MRRDLTTRSIILEMRDRFSKIQISFTFLVPAYPGSPGQWAVKWVCVTMGKLPGYVMQIEQFKF